MKSLQNPWTHVHKLSQLSFRKPIVYGWFRGDTCLYIGMSSVGLPRPLGRPHYVIGDLEPVQPDDELRWIEYSTIQQARDMEWTLIRAFDPVFNLSHRPIQKGTIQDLWNAISTAKMENEKIAVS